MSKAMPITLALGLVTAAFLAVACRDAVTPDDIGQPSFGGKPPPQQECPAVKMTGGGRIDFPPGGPDKNPPASHEYETFGAHVIQGRDQSGNCAIKGTLEWVDHRLSQRLNGRPLNLHGVPTFAEIVETSDCQDGALFWGGNLVRKNDGQTSSFIVFDCDNGEPGAKHDAFEIFAPEIDYQVTCPPPDFAGGPPGCVLTGGNRQFHKTKP
jgi:hypothetical protein